MINLNDKEDQIVVFPSGQIRESQFTWRVYYPDKVDGSAKFRFVDHSMYAIKRLKAIADIFNDDGSYNIENKRAERYAICLSEDKKFFEAFKIFLALTKGSEKVLLVENEEFIEKRIFPSVANMPGKLGYEGAFRFASLCMENAKKKKRGLAIFREFAEKVPVRCDPWRLREILTEALKILLENGIDKIGEIDVREKLEASIESQF